MGIVFYCDYFEMAALMRAFFSPVSSVHKAWCYLGKRIVMHVFDQMRKRVCQVRSLAATADRDGSSSGIGRHTRACVPVERDGGR